MKSRKMIYSVISFTLSGLLHASAAGAQAPEKTPASPMGKVTVDKTSENYGNLPLAFEANNGQAQPGVKFLSHGSGYSLLLTNSNAILALHAPPCKPQPADATPLNCASSQDLIQVGLENSTTRPSQPSAEDPLPGKVNYFLGNAPKNWRTNLPTYARVRYPSVYPGIDLVYYGNHRQLEFDFVVAPGANPKSIHLAFDGGRLSLGQNGDLTVSVGHGQVTLHKPLVYQQIKGEHRPIEASFALPSNRTLKFNIGPYDHSQPLIIDPVLVYSTYLGGSGGNGIGDQANGIAVDSGGAAYIVGTTDSANFPITGEAFQTQDPSATLYTVFVTKMNAAGTALLYSTYLGGSGGAGDFGYGIALDANDKLYITGSTYSTDFPTTCGAFQTTNNAAADGQVTGFVTRLNVHGNALEYSTYLGGSRKDVAQAITADVLGNAYVTGYTDSSDFPVTPKAFQTQFGGNSGNFTPTAFVTKLNPTGSALVYSTYLGGSGTQDSGDYGNSIAIDRYGAAYIAGSTFSADFPVTSGAFQKTNNGRPNFLTTGFASKLSPSGSKLLYSTYFGGSGGDFAEAIAVDSEGSAYLAGTTSSPDFPVTSGILEGSATGPELFYAGSSADVTGFVAKLNQDASAPVYSTYLEGANTFVHGMTIDSTGAAYVTGTTVGTGAGNGLFGTFQTTPDALPSPTSSGTSAYLVKLDPSATVLNYATLLGGSLGDWGSAVAVDRLGDAYVTGFANSTDFPVTTGAFQTTNHKAYSGDSNAFVSKFAISAEANLTPYPIPPSGNQTSMTLVSQDFEWANDGLCDEFTITVNANLNSAPNGPSPTGMIAFYGYWENEFFSTVGGGSDGVTPLSLFGASLYEGGSGLGDWQAVYSGDSTYLGSMLSGSAPVPTCTPTQQIQRGSRLSSIHGHLKFLHSSATSSLRSRLSAQGPKFTPPAPGPLSSSPIRPADQQTPACIATLPPLTVTLVPASATRIYGHANPTFSFATAGLLNGDTVTVTPSTTATVTSPVGAYPVTASVTGSAAANYSIYVANATLTVRKSLLTLAATSYSTTYGTGLQPTAYTLTGFLNGDTASVVTGQPVLTAPVTPTTAAGRYPISIGFGTLQAANYGFERNGPIGYVQINKAPLTATATSFTIHKGDPIPTLTYSLTGFVNGETAATAVSGAPHLATTATAHSAPGSYPIVITLGTLTSTNYEISRVNGTLTILP